MTTPTPRDEARRCGCDNPEAHDYTPRDTGPALDPRAVEAAAEASPVVTRACPWHHRTDCGCRETRVSADVWAVAVALHARRGYGKPPVCPDCIADAAAALTAAAPFLRAEGAAAAQAEVGRLTALVNAKQAWIEGAKVDLDGYADDQADYEVAVRSLTAERDDARAEVERARAEGAAAERQRIAAAIRAQRDLFARADAVWIALDLAAVRIADPGTTAPTEGDDRD